MNTIDLFNIKFIFMQNNLKIITPKIAMTKTTIITVTAAAIPKK